MTDRREHAVVLFGVHRAHVGAGCAPQRLDPRDVLRPILRQRAQDDVAPDVEIGQRGFDAARLAARNRVARHELRHTCAQRGPGSSDDVALRAARVRDKRRFAEKRLDSRKQRRGLRNRCGDQHEIGAG